MGFPKTRISHSISAEAVLLRAWATFGKKLLGLAWIPKLFVNIDFYKREQLGIT